MGSLLHPPATFFAQTELDTRNLRVSPRRSRVPAAQLRQDGAKKRERVPESRLLPIQFLGTMAWCAPRLESTRDLAGVAGEESGWRPHVPAGGADNCQRQKSRAWLQFWDQRRREKQKHCRSPLPRDQLRHHLFLPEVLRAQTNPASDARHTTRCDTAERPIRWTAQPALKPPIACPPARTRPQSREAQTETCGGGCQSGCPAIPHSKP